MELKSGYKQTEVGVIPEAWGVVELKEIADPEKKWSFTGGPFGSNLKSSDYTEEGVRIIQLQNIGDGSFLNNYQIYTSSKKADELISCNIYPGEIILSKMGDPVARACIIPDFHDRYLMCSDGIRLKVNPELFDKYYIYCVINHEGFRTRASNAGTGSTRKRIGLTELRQLKLQSPTKAEQEAIAGALSDADELIASLEQLIEKKRMIKQGAMQELLTGKKRLPGFQQKPGYKQTEVGEIPEDWEVSTLGIICRTITTGKLDANAMVPNGQYRFYTCAKEHFYINNYAFDAEALLISGNGANVGYVHYYKGKFNAYQRTYILADFDCSIKFVEHFLSEKLALRISTEVNAGNTPYIVRGTLSDMLLGLPLTKAEQEAIATVLSDMDTEIEALEKKLEKARKIKAGMMHNLLTGTIRLV